MTEILLKVALNTIALTLIQHNATIDISTANLLSKTKIRKILTQWF